MARTHSLTQKLLAVRKRRPTPSTLAFVSNLFIFPNIPNRSPRPVTVIFVLLPSVPGYDKEWRRQEILRTEQKVDADKKKRKGIADRRLMHDLFTT